MLALTIKQPWAWAILWAGKDIENRSWASQHRGPLLIHSSKSVSRAEFERSAEFMRSIGVTVPSFAELQSQMGVVLGAVTLLDCVESADSPWWIGPVGWKLTDPRPWANPVPCSGKLGLWEFDGPVEPIVQPSRPRQAIQRDLFGRVTSVRSLTPTPAVEQLSLI
ncbi:hypothetical protein E6Q11_01305 [Candidatus Dojkabacteria bacterium]|uniref:ASCH domain-containing protein n=1 Tax=Candidatus Dojkabacteria bacterium TaxID=2099670 RepID=A0A5C7J9Y9_9BACT|nr:MAG: hypothetical protein E6Q11_01305 [Candidatus Dojkabacteria bacterium]